jgi:hypothetical protein
MTVVIVPALSFAVRARSVGRQPRNAISRRKRRTFT